MSDRDYWDSSSTQRAHLKSARDSAKADYYSNPKHRSEKAYKQFKHSVDYAERGYPDVNEKTAISDLCEDCYNDIKSYIHDKIFERAKKQMKGLIN